MADRVLKQPLPEEEIRRLCRSALDMRSRSYVPYSHFRVGAAVLTEDGQIFTGCNVENAAYSVTICAERVALTKAISEGYRRFAAIAIAGGREDGPLKYCPPCGTCRQLMSEFCGGDFPIYLPKAEDDWIVYTLEQLLPERFGPGDLNRDQA